MQTKSLCAKISTELHAQITTEKEKLGIPLNEYIEQLIIEYYQLTKGETNMNKEVRTLAIQVSPELMQRLDAYLNVTGIKKKMFLIQLLEHALDVKERELSENTTN